MLEYICLPFESISLHQLYQMMKLRQQVFIVEQDCPYLDADDKDLVSHHVLGIDSFGIIQAHSRLVPPGISYDNYSSIGRVVNSETIRGHGEGKRLMEFSIAQISSIFPNNDIKISAQSYLLSFYSSLGFKPIGQEYLEDNIPHTAMILSLKLK